MSQAIATRPPLGTVKIVVPEGRTERYNGKLYGPGECFWVPKRMACLYKGERKPNQPLACFPDRVCGSKGEWKYHDTYVDLIVLPAGVEVLAPVPVIECCARPACAEFVQCGGGCLFMDLDTPIPDIKATITGGAAPHINPSRIDLCGNDATNIHLLSNVDMIVNIYYWGNCC